MPPFAPLCCGWAWGFVRDPDTKSRCDCEAPLDYERISVSDEDVTGRTRLGIQHVQIK